MRKNLSIFFLLILALPAVYKVGFYTFYQLNKDYIAENYCINIERPITMCYGSCFLEKGLNLMNQAPHPDSVVSTLKFEAQEFLVDEVATPTCCTQTILTFSFSPTPSITEGIGKSILRPPLA